MIGELDDREAQFEAGMERYASGLNRAVRDLGMALGQASLMKDETEALRSKKAAKAACTKTEEQIKAEFAKAMNGYLTGVPRRDRRYAGFDFRW